MKEKLPPGEKRNKQPDEGLTLDYVFGFVFSPHSSSHFPPRLAIEVTIAVTTSSV